MDKQIGPDICEGVRLLLKQFCGFEVGTSTKKLLK